MPHSLLLPIMTSLYAYEAGPVATIGYLVVDTANGLAVAIDAPQGVTEAVLAQLHADSVRLAALLLTHTHWDHTADAATLVAATGCDVYVHADDVYRLTHPMQHTVWPLPFTIESVVPTHVLQGGEAVRFGSFAVHVMHTPGHTEGGLCFVDDEEHRVFAGDTLFAGSVGRCDLPGGDMEVLLDSIQEKLFTLPNDYVVYPGHGPATTLGAERVSNPYVI